ncbi:MAG: CNNM domain-containing protein [Nocardioidaceae bacterium]
MSPTASIAIAIALLLGNAFFVACEFAMVAARPSKVEPLAAGGSRLARTTLVAMDQLSYLIAAAQLGITVCSLGLGAIAEPALAHLIEPAALAVGLPNGWIHPVALTISMLIVIYLHVVLGEMVPKNVALAGPERAAMIFGPQCSRWSRSSNQSWSPWTGLLTHASDCFGCNRELHDRCLHPR